MQASRRQEGSFERMVVDPNAYGRRTPAWLPCAGVPPGEGTAIRPWRGPIPLDEVLDYRLERDALQGIGMP